MIKINCIYNDDGAWCKNKLVKRSLWGIGARCCLEYPHGHCSYKVVYLKPEISPPSPRPNKGMYRAPNWTNL